jgi:hypothetical protein
MSAHTDTAALRARVAENEGWYHTIALPGGVLTPGQVDLRTSAPKLLPDHLDG